MFRLAYRNFGDHESLVGNYTVSAGGVAGVRWFELRNVTSRPGDGLPGEHLPARHHLALDGQRRHGRAAATWPSASAPPAARVFPSIRYAGRLASDPLNTLAQGEATLFAGTGSQTGTGNRWGDYSDLTVDPVDDCTFWYTNEYYPAGVTTFNWRTRIGNFKFPGCVARHADADRDRHAAHRDGYRDRAPRRTRRRPP